MKPLFAPLLLALVATTACTSRGAEPSTANAAAPVAAPDSNLQQTPAAPPVSAESKRIKATPRQAKIVAAARRQEGTAYVADYVSIPYPNGDVPSGTGACTDVVVRAWRGIGMDLQRLVHEDMKANFGLYPKRWGLRRPDTSIDHRRVPNLVVFFRRFGTSLPTGTTGTALATWQPGDIVTWVLDNGRDHCGVVTDTIGPSGLPTVVHNLGRCADEDVLTTWKIVGHYRYPKGL